jgi:hypothetical protein
VQGLEEGLAAVLTAVAIAGELAVGGQVHQQLLTSAVPVQLRAIAAVDAGTRLGAVGRMDPVVPSRVLDVLNVPVWQVHGLRRLPVLS